MRRLVVAAAVFSLFTVVAQADVIKPVDARATSQFGLGLYIENLINGDSGPAVGVEKGLVAAGEPGVLDDRHGLTVGGDPTTNFGWISGCGDAGIAGGDPGIDCGGDPFAVEPVDDQIIEFELDGSYDLTDIHIWNDNTRDFGGARAVEEFEIQVSPDRTGDTFTPVGTTYTLTSDPGTDENSAQVVSFAANGVRRVRFLLNSNFGDQYVGLAEVRFTGTVVTQDPLSDADKNGVAGGGDLIIWQRNLGLGEVEDSGFATELTATQSEGDFDSNNVVRAADREAWEGEFGFGIPAVASAAGVPEPTTAALLVLGGGAALASRRPRLVPA